MTRMRLSRDWPGLATVLQPDRPPVAPADRDQAEERLHHVERPELGARDVVPLVEGELVDRRVDAGTTRPSPGGHHPREDLDVEDPSRAERRLEQGDDLGRHAEELRPALRVVDTHPQRQRGRTREDPPEIVPQRLAPHGPAEKPDPGAEDHLDLGPEVEDRAKRQDIAQGRREVGVPVAHVFGALRESPENALADRLGLADIRAQVADEEAPGASRCSSSSRSRVPSVLPSLTSRNRGSACSRAKPRSASRSSLSASL